MHTKKLLTGKLPHTLTNDYLFHIVFQKNPKILRGLIRSLLKLKNEEIIDSRLENPITPGEKADDKTLILDLLITLNGNQKINIEMQVLNTKDWPERSLTYLCRSFDNLESGNDYINVMPVIHIGILDYTLFPKYPEFYAHYAMMNIINHNIYSDKLLLNVLDLTQINIATETDIVSGLKHWAQLFKATTWEEIQMLTTNYKDLENIVDIVQEALADKDIRLQCEARERYERDRTSLYNSGHREGHREGHITGLNEGIEKAIHMMKAANASKETTITQLMEQFDLSEEKAFDKVNLYWDDLDNKL